MVSVFLSHSSKDKPFVRQLADFLRKHDFDPWLDESELTPDQNFASRIDEALKANFVLLIASPDALASEWVKREWTAGLQANKLALILYRDCQHLPPLLSTQNFIDLRTNHPEGFRKIHTWLLNQKPASPPRSLLPSHPPLFIERPTELAFLKNHLQPGRLAALTGMPGRGKSTLALEFAHRHQTDFDSVYWLPCQSQNLITIASDLQRQLGLKIDGDLNQLLTELKNHCASKRTLLILDNVEDESPAQLIPGGNASVLVTTRQPGLQFLRPQKAKLPVEDFTEDQCFEVFRQVLGDNEITSQESDCRKLFKRIEYLPIAVTILAGLVKYDVHYTIASVAANLPHDAKQLIQEAINALEERPRQLLSAMSACAPDGFSLSLAAAILNLNENDSLDALQPLFARSLVEELNKTKSRYRLHALVRDVANGRQFAKQHAEAVAERFDAWETNWKQCEQDAPDFQLALDWALANRENLPESFADNLAFKGFSLNDRIGHPAEALEICQRLASDAEQREDKSWRQAWLGNQALILQAWGRLDESLALHKQKEALCLELGNKDSLQRSYGNQALILQAWGRLDEALALHKREEALCLELDSKDGLQACYGNQALILKAWGRLDEALALLKQQEALCLELGNKDGLHRSYGNQANILQAWGRLDEALALHKQQEALCLELGNKDSLQRSYNNQALILQAWGRLEEALTLLKQQEALCLELGNKDGLHRSNGNQANILQAWGRLDEALVLLKQKEALCLELSNKSGLGYCYWNWGLLARDQNHPPTEHQKLTAALALFTELKMHRERDAVAAELAKTTAIASRLLKKAKHVFNLCLSAFGVRATHLTYAEPPPPAQPPSSHPPTKPTAPPPHSA